MVSICLWLYIMSLKAIPTITNSWPRSHGWMAGLWHHVSAGQPEDKFYRNQSDWSNWAPMISRDCSGVWVMWSDSNKPPSYVHTWMGSIWTKNLLNTELWKMPTTCSSNLSPIKWPITTQQPLFVLFLTPSLPISFYGCNLHVSILLLYWSPPRLEVSAVPMQSHEFYVTLLTQYGRQHHFEGYGLRGVCLL